MQWFWPLSWFNNAFLSSCSRKDTHASPKFSLKDESISMNCILWKNPDRWFESLFTIHIKSIHSLPCALLSQVTSTCHHRAHARSWWRISSRPCCAAACGAQFSTAAAAQGDLEGGNRQVLTQLTQPLKLTLQAPHESISHRKGKVPGDCRGIWIRC